MVKKCKVMINVDVSSFAIGISDNGNHEYSILGF